MGCIDRLQKEKEDTHSKAADETLDSIGRRLVNLFDLRPALTNIIITSILVLAIAFTNNLSHSSPEWMGDASWARYFLQSTIFIQIIYASTRTIGLPILTIAFSSALLISSEASGTYVIPETLCQSIFAVGFIGIGAAAIFKR